MINLPIGHGLVGTAIYKGKAVIITEDEDGQMFVFDNDSPELEGCHKAKVIDEIIDNLFDRSTSRHQPYH